MGILFETDGRGKRLTVPRHKPSEGQTFAEYIQSILDKTEPITCADLESISWARLGRTTPEVERRRPRPPADLPSLKDNVVILSHANARKRRVRLQDATIIPFDAHWRVPDQLRQALTAVSRDTTGGPRRRTRPRYDE